MGPFAAVAGVWFAANAAKRVQNAKVLSFFICLRAYELVHTPGFPAFRRGRLIKVSKIAFFEWMAKGSETVPGSDK